MYLTLQFLICTLTLIVSLYLYIDASNDVIEKKLMIPQAQKELREILAKNAALRYEIDRFESPLHLMELARKPEFSHLKTPYFKDIIQIPLGAHE